MAINVDIADRMYDYTDEEVAAEAVDEFQSIFGLGDEAIVKLWASDDNPSRHDLEKRIFKAVDENGSAYRAKNKIPCGISLYVA